jgi:uncharacterized protein YyaL (SSP411 family)
VLQRYPIALTEALVALDFAAASPREIVIVAPSGRRADARPFLDVLRSTYAPCKVTIVTEDGPQLETLARLTPLVRGKGAREGRVTAYACRGGACGLPTTDPAVLARQLREAAPPPVASP